MPTSQPIDLEQPRSPFTSSLLHFFTSSLLHEWSFHFSLFTFHSSLFTLHFSLPSDPNHGEREFPIFGV
jgi:hypothetical protein